MKIYYVPCDQVWKNEVFTQDCLLIQRGKYFSKDIFLPLSKNKEREELPSSVKRVEKPFSVLNITDKLRFPASCRDVYLPRIRYITNPRSEDATFPS